jgi:hypothetical protein
VDPFGFASPEDAALATWNSATSARPRVVSVEVRGDRAEVVIDTQPSHPDYVYCVRREGRWFEVVSSNAQTHRWDDPDFLDWD